jgi:hypothetical protein
MQREVRNAQCNINNKGEMTRASMKKLRYKKKKAASFGAASLPVF